MSTSGLLSPITINTLVVRNRAVMPSMLTNFATKGGDVTERLIHYYAERAKGGVGLVSIEGTAVEPRGTAFIRGISAADDSKIKGLSKLAKAIKAHGYLISQFVSPLTNHREDAYGGSLENRLRMPLAVIRAIRKAVGDDFPISYRHNADDGLPGGMTLEETLQLVNPLVDAGVDALHISAGIGETKHLISPPSCTPEAWLSDAARQVKEAVRNRVPVISVGRYVHPAIADQVIRDGKADMVAFGRALIAEPELINKYAENRLDSVRVCLGCNEGCTGHTGKLLDITCAINPRAGYEGKYPLGVKADKALKVAVVGAGPAGLQAALTAAQRGHSVTLFERGEDIGGLLHPASRPPFKDSLMELVRYFRHELDALGVNIRCGVTVTGQLLQAQAFDMTLLATGSRPVIPRFAAELPNMTTAEHILLEAIKPGHRVLIIGGGMIGCELADFLGERGHAVTILEMRPEVAQDMEWRAYPFVPVHVHLCRV